MSDSTNDYTGPVFTQPSGRWLTWKIKRSPKTCTKCLMKNGKIYHVSEVIPQRPPIHLYCRCLIILLQAILAGTATIKGDMGADWLLKNYLTLPNDYITKKMAIARGWISSKGNLLDVAPGGMIGGDVMKTEMAICPLHEAESGMKLI